VSTWFGRSRVQDRAGDSDERGVMDDPMAGRDDSTPNDDVPSRHSGWVDEKVLASAQSASARPASNGSDPVAGDNDHAIDALRAATSAAGERTEQPSIDDIAQVRRLHEMRVDAEHRSRRALIKPGARRKFQYALTAETAALRMIGFGSFEAFSAVYGAAPSADNGETESVETIARIQELLTELGVDPHGDPLRAASDFLTAHERVTSDLESLSLQPAQPAAAFEPMTEPEAAPPEATADHLDITDDAPGADSASTAAAIADAPLTLAPAEPTDGHDTANGAAPIAEPDVEIEPGIGAVVGAPPASGSRPEAIPEDAPGDTETAAAEIEPAAAEPTVALEPEAPWVPAAQLPATSPNEIRRPDDDVLDRWIHAEARAERMHAEVDRAQAELVAMLARSADLERTVVSRADELETANAELAAANRELETVRARVDELERTIARSDTERDELERTIARSDTERDELERAIARSGTERDELERALTASRDRVTDLEATLQTRELALAEASRERASALESAAELEMTLAARASELDEARATVTALESELAAQAARLDRTSGELGAVRANAEELTTELETTRRALDALDTHAEAIEAELAEARRAADSSEIRQELDAVRREVTEARRELGHLEFQRAETDRSLAQDRIELQQLQHTLATTRDEAIVVLDELTAVRQSVEDTAAQVEQAERAREAITIDAADVLARAEAEATSLLERANRDAEAICQEAAQAREVGLRDDDVNRFGSGTVNFGDDTLAAIIQRIERLERKLAKQRRRLDRISKEPRPEENANASAPKGRPASAGAVDELTRLVTIAGATEPAPSVATARPGTGDADLDAAAVIAAAEREAAEIRRAARRERQQFRTELVALLSRLAPLAEPSVGADDDDDDDEDEDW